ncbi:hypothetical protein, partial [Enterocloster clostridioformis]|uniref:hypothetical protein n=1 Tax=Enterocloster clostridioformis TaxID=1531 RepID=UPI001FA74047
MITAITGTAAMGTIMAGGTETMETETMETETTETETMETETATAEMATATAAPEEPMTITVMPAETPIIQAGARTRAASCSRWRARYPSWSRN